MTNRPDVIELALAALRANHQHHQDYDEHAGYPESELCEQNTKAIAALEQVPAAPADDLMVNMVPPATSRDRWMYEQGRLAERDPRTHVAVQTAPAVSLSSVDLVSDERALLQKAAQVISWHSFGECRAFCDGPIPEPSDVVGQIKEVLSRPFAPAPVSLSSSGVSEQPAFPERDPSKPAEQQGMFRKFDVRRVDGSDQPGGKHHGCRYFVLDLDHDKAAPAGMRGYAAEIRATHPKLADDIEAEFGEQPAAQTAGVPEGWKLVRHAMDLLIKQHEHGAGMFPQVAEEHREDIAAIRSVLKDIDFYEPRIQLAAAPQPVAEQVGEMAKWISVEDRLPENAPGYFIVYRGNVLFPSVNVYYACNADELFSDKAITHWMHVPPNPQAAQAKGGDK